MIERLTLTNFQSHTSSTVTFSPNVTAIVGDGNQGKSVIFKALYKLVRDKPNGVSFIQDDKIGCLVSADTEFGNVVRGVKRNHAADKNMYTVLPKGGESIPFMKFGKTGIPQEVLDVLHVSPIQKFGDEELDINFQKQISDLFLMVGEGLPSLRGKVLGRITGVDTAQRALQKAASNKKALTQEKNELQEGINELTADLVKYDTLDVIIGDYNTAIKIQGDANLKAAEHANLIHIRDSIKIIVDSAVVQRDLIKSLDVDLDKDILQLRALESKLVLYRKLQQVQLDIAKAEVLADLDLNVLDNLPRCNDLLGIDGNLRELMSIQEKIDVSQVFASMNIDFDTAQLTKLRNRQDLLSLVVVNVSEQHKLTEVAAIEIPDTTTLTTWLEHLKRLQDLQLSCISTSGTITDLTNELSKADNNLNEVLADLEVARNSAKVCGECGQTIE